MTSFALSKPKFLLEAYIPIFAWAALIYFLSSQQTLPGLDVSAFDFLFKKLSHVTVYGVLYYLIVRAFYFHFDAKHTKYWYVAFLLCLLYAITDEIHQSFIPSRTPTVGDIGFDMIGVTIVFLKQYRYI